MLHYLQYFLGPIGDGILFYLYGFMIVMIIVNLLLSRYTQYHWVRLMSYLWAFFFFIALGLVFFPFPEFTETFCSARMELLTRQTTPFQFFADIQTYASTHRLTWLSWYVRNKALFQVVFNIFLIAPVGIVLWTLTTWKWRKVCIVWLGLSLWFELLQGTGLFWILPCPYRLFDVDDLILNSSGFFIGYYIIYPWKKRIQNTLFSQEHVDKDRVSLLRRFMAISIDFFIAYIIFFILPLPNIFNQDTTTMIVMTVILYILLVLIPYITQWYTIGKYIMNIKITSFTKKSTISFSQLVWRYSLLIITFVILILWSNFFLVDGAMGDPRIWYLEKAFVILFLLILPILVEIDKDGIIFYEHWSKTKNMRMKKELHKYSDK